MLQWQQLLNLQIPLVQINGNKRTPNILFYKKKMTNLAIGLRMKNL